MPSFIICWDQKKASINLKKECKKTIELNARQKGISELIR
jgi:hypothetical protein